MFDKTAILIVKILFVCAAYEVLSDKEKRRKYDTFGEDGEQSQDGHRDFKNFNFDEFFKNFDDAFKYHKGHHYQQHSTDHQFHSHGPHRPFKFTFGNDGRFFNFDDLFDDADSDFFHDFSFKNNGHRGMHREFHNHMFNDFMDGDLLRHHNKYSRNMNNFFHHEPQSVHSNYQNFHSFGHSHNGGEIPLYKF